MSSPIRSLADLFAQLAGLIATRLELVGLEARQAVDHWLRLLGMLLLALVFWVLALLVATLIVALYFWPTDYRWWALGGLAVLYALLGAGLSICVVHRLSRQPAAFAVTLDVLRADADALAAHGVHGGNRTPGQASAPSEASASSQSGMPDGRATHRSPGTVDDQETPSP